MAALSAYVDFGQLSPDVASATTDPPRRSGFLRKGLLLQEVDAMLGPPAKTTDRKEGTLSVRTREYVTPDGKVTTDFVEGVLIRYTIASD